MKLPPAAHSEETKTIDEEKEVVLEDEVQIKQRIPPTILSEDEGYLLEDGQPIGEVGLRVEACGEFLSSECKTAKPKKKKRTAVSYRRPKTRPTNKLRWNMKKILNPKLNLGQEAVVIDSSSNEEAEIDKQGSKSKRKSMAKSSLSSQPEKTKIPQSVGEFEQPRSKLSEIVLEIKNKLLEQQQYEKARMCPIESQH